MSFEPKEVNAKLPLLICVAACVLLKVPMTRYIGMDVHNRQLVVCIVDRKRKVLKRSL